MRVEALADELAELARAMLADKSVADALVLAMLADELALAMTSCPAIDRYCMREVQKL